MHAPFFIYSLISTPLNPPTATYFSSTPVAVGIAGTLVVGVVVPDVAVVDGVFELLFAHAFGFD